MKITEALIEPACDTPNRRFPRTGRDLGEAPVKGQTFPAQPGGDPSGAARRSPAGGRARRTVLALALCVGLLLFCPGCKNGEGAPEARLRAVATSYPMYVLAQAVTAGAQGVEISRLSTGQVSCLHDYTLTISDMRSLERADIALLNGGGLEEFLDGVLAQLDALQVDCSQAVSLLESGESEGHDHEHSHSHGHDHEDDPHYWMDPLAFAQAAYAAAQGFAQADPDNEALYLANAQAAAAALEEARLRWQEELDGLSCPKLITFHDGFQYFANAFGFELLFSMEEEDGATASARDIRTAAQLVRDNALPAVFAEENGSASAARAVMGETGCALAELSMLMDGPDAPGGLTAAEIVDQLYIAPMDENIATLREVLK